MPGTSATAGWTWAQTAIVMAASLAVVVSALDKGPFCFAQIHP